MGSGDLKAGGRSCAPHSSAGAAWTDGIKKTPKEKTKKAFRRREREIHEIHSIQLVEISNGLYIGMNIWELKRKSFFKKA